MLDDTPDIPPPPLKRPRASQRTARQPPSQSDARSKRTEEETQIPRSSKSKSVGKKREIKGSEEGSVSVVKRARRPKTTNPAFSEETVERLRAAIPPAIHPHLTNIRDDKGCVYRCLSKTSGYLD